MEEGGLGVLDLKEVQDSLFMKFAWKLLKGGSIWADFFRKKYVGQEDVYKINEAGVRLKSNKPDVLIWKHSVEGNFTTRAKRRAVPTDDIVQSLDIPVVSKCHSCVLPCVELLQHVLCEGQSAQRVWRYFSNSCQIRLPHIRNWKGMMVYWWQRATSRTQVAWIQGVLPILISWASRKARCSSRMEGIIFNIEGIIRYVKCLLKEVACSLQNFQKIRKGDSMVMHNFSLPIIPTHQKKVKYVKWKTPHSGMIKLNVDGGARTNPGEAGGGGVIRDSSGRCIAGFAHFYRNATNTAAECSALLDGLRLCKQLQFQNDLIESDSSVVMNWLASGIYRL
ncbi:uncharacterized protein LOC122296652 [Carya illinoinensis]|uniref:uncharacterized protein LOC122296652 n=1 Tax=Carya illinoinensis TaxID=32201 RepID=UPI001C728836|nr:uncharacterized protein LOC122296652 [Carya illinoinensis]